MATAKTAPRAAKTATEAFETDFTVGSTEAVRENICDRSDRALIGSFGFRQAELRSLGCLGCRRSKGL